jgi:FkbM family methyltransferase
MSTSFTLSKIPNCGKALLAVGFLAAWDFGCVKLWRFLSEPARERLKRYIDSSDTIRRRLAGILGTGQCQVVQVGSNDGVSNDPLRAFLEHDTHRAILIEPVPSIHEKLSRLYAGYRNVVTLNLAISRDAGPQSFFVVSDRAKEELGEKYQDWYCQLGSFVRENIEKHKNGLLSRYIHELAVSTATLDQVLERHAFASVDLLHIDAEGYDLQVLRTLDLGSNAPRAILIEHKHLRLTEKLQFLLKMSRLGYRIHIYHDDALLIKDAPN